MASYFTSSVVFSRAVSYFHEPGGSAITASVEYGQIFHVTRIRKYYCKNMKYRINTKYSTLPRGISVYFEPKVGIFSEAEGRGKYSLQRVQYMPIFHKEGF